MKCSFFNNYYCTGLAYSSFTDVIPVRCQIKKSRVKLCNQLSLFRGSGAPTYCNRKMKFSLYWLFIWLHCFLFFFHYCFHLKDSFFFFHQFLILNNYVQSDWNERRFVLPGRMSQKPFRPDLLDQNMALLQSFIARSYCRQQLTIFVLIVWRR